MPEQIDKTRVTEPLRQICPDYGAMSEERLRRTIEKARAEELERLTRTDRTSRSPPKP